MSRAFSYRAARADGSIATGELQAPDRPTALRDLTALGLFPIRLAPAVLRRERAMSPRDVASGLRMLASLLGAGLPAQRAFETFAGVSPGSWRTGIVRARQRLLEGSGVSDALSDSGLLLPDRLIGIIRAGEGGSGLAAAVNRAADAADASAKVSASIRQALAYPAVLAIIGTISIGVVIGIVLPRFAAIIGDMGGAIPPLARFILAAGAAAKVLALPVVALWLIAWGGWRRWTSKPVGLNRWHEMLLKVPVLGTLRAAAASSRVCATLAALLASGVPLAAALTHGAASAGDAAVSARLLVARERVLGGHSFSVAAESSGALTALAIGVIRVGEDTGDLASMLERAADLDGADLAQRLELGVRLLEPALIVMFAGVVGLVTAALLQAVYAVRP